jgi:pyruvate carboxylase
VDGRVELAALHRSTQAYPDNVVVKFIQLAVKNGVDIFRVRALLRF